MSFTSPLLAGAVVAGGCVPEGAVGVTGVVGWGVVGAGLVPQPERSMFSMITITIKRDIVFLVFLMISLLSFSYRYLNSILA